jgi:diaminohydroxyphosphoribosylaminopyrimidine deaminase/5-amino-6-(5-phosphoribosylamino)uracil reductase
MSHADEKWMQQALELAERGRGFVEPNPLVGAVIVQDEQVVGAGWHQRYGEAHAEIVALAAAGARARGGRLYVTLEPCCHHGKTPPCTAALVEAGIVSVMAAHPDPFPAVAGKGAAELEAAGIPCTFGPGEKAARRLNAPYLKQLATGRPYVHAKWAMSLDGKIATRTGNSKWISSPASRAWVHALRGRMDAIIVGSGTARTDDPLLTARPPGPRTPLRIVLCSSAELPSTAQLVQTARETPVLVATTTAADSSAVRQLRSWGIEVLSMEKSDHPTRAAGLLDELGRRRFTNVLVEGGAGVFGSFLDASLIDEVHVFLAPMLIGGATALTPISGQGAETLAQAVALEEWHVEQLDRDLVIHGHIKKPDS